MIVALRAALGGAVLALVLVACSVLPTPGLVGTPVPAGGPELTAGSRPGAAPAGPLPETRVAPYVDLTTPPLPDLGAVADASGQRDVVLAFVLSDERSCTPTWGGTTPMTDPAIAAGIAALRARGGTTTLSSGGAVGDYLETRCPDAASLARAYGTALDAAGTDHLDVDIETDTGRDVSMDRVADALAQLQRSRGTRITLTVQVEDAETGMTPDAEELVRTVSARGVAARVNLMVMNFEQGEDWSASMLGAADAATRTLAAIWPGSEPAEVAERVGLTLMIGQNDTEAVTTPDDAAAVVQGARDRGYGFVGSWSLMRDNGGCPGDESEADDCSGIEQTPWVFTRTLQRFA